MISVPIGLIYASMRHIHTLYIIYNDDVAAEVEVTNDRVSIMIKRKNEFYFDIISSIVLIIMCSLKSTSNFVTCVYILLLPFVYVQKVIVISQGWG